MFYSKTTSGFYSQAIHGDNIPGDAVEITAEQHAALLQGQSDGKQIVPDESGFPVLITPEFVPYSPQSITMRQCRLQMLADDILDDVDSAVTAMGAAAKIEWEYAATVERGNVLVQAIQSIVSWDNERADQFFVEAAQL